MQKTDLLFVTSHKFIKNNKGIFTSGSLTDEILGRYEKIFGEMSIFSYFIYDSFQNEKMKISNKNLYLFSRRNLIGLRKIKILSKLITNHKYVIIRGGGINGFLTAMLCKMKKKKYLVEVIGCPWDALTHHSLIGKIIAPFEFLITRNVIKNASFAIYVTKEFLQRRYPSNGKTEFCSDVELNESNEKDILNRRLLKIHEEHKKIILGTAAGVAVKYKGQQYVIKALKYLKDQGCENFEYQLAGTGNQDRLKKLAQNLGIFDKVKFLGLLDHNSIFEWYDSLDIYILPSQQEGLPRSLVEAMSRGLPCIGSKVGGIPELLDSTHILNSATNIKELANKIHSFTPEEMENAAKINIQKAHEFEKISLSEKRRSFYYLYKKEQNQCTLILPH